MTLTDLRDRLRDWPGATSGGAVLPGVRRLFGTLAVLVVLGMLPGLLLFGTWPQAPFGVVGVGVLAVLWRRLLRPVDVGAREIVVDASVGVVVCDGDTDAETLLGNADVAMYRAKRSGKARAEVFDPSMHGRALERLTLRNELSRAIPAGDVVVHYQPVVELGSGRIGRRGPGPLGAPGPRTAAARRVPGSRTCSASPCTS